MKRFLNIALLVSFLVTIMVPLTGVRIHKLASGLFLLGGFNSSVILIFV